MKASGLRELEVLQQEAAHEREIQSTAEGRTSSDLRRRGMRRKELGHRRGALELLRQAVSLHAPTDEGAAAASARYALGCLLSEDPRASRQALITAEQLLRQALRSPTLAHATRRCAQTEKALAACMRRMASLWGKGCPPSLLDDIQALYRSALGRLKSCGQLGIDELAEGHVNYANFLGEQRGDFAGAMNEYDRAISLVRYIERKLGQPMRHVFYRACWGQVALLVQRGKPRDVARAERILVDALEEGDLEYEDRTRLALADVLLSGSAPERFVRAQELLARVRPDRLTEEDGGIPRLATVLRRARAPDAALRQLQGFISRSIHHRARHTIADFEADTASIDFQAAAALAARIYQQEKQDALSAFLVLENTSGLRFAEALAEHAWRPTTPLARKMREERQKYVHRTYDLDVIARYIDRLAPAEQQQHLDELLSQPEAFSSVDDDGSTLETLGRARQEGIPVTYLDSRIQEGVQHVEQLTLALQRIEPDFGEVKRVLGSELQASELLSLLREHPDHVLLRLDLLEELLLVGVWLDHDTLVTRSAVLPVPHELHECLQRATQDTTRFRDHARLTALFSRMDLSAALPPSGHMGRAVLLPSNSASQLPLAALGPPGARLIDRFDSIVWLPCLFPLRLRPAPTPPRAEHVVFVPGQETSFHELALPPRPGQERRLEGPAANFEQLQRAAAGARVLSIYTHGQHAPGEPARLLLPGKQELDLTPLSPLLQGAERVELWACQSGTNRPMDPLTPFVNEAFGLDFLLLHAGVRSAIGTLWSVPDLITAVLARRFHQRIAEGSEAARALAEAQRWWLAVGVDEFLRHLRESPSEEEAFADFTASLGVALDARAFSECRRALGPYEEEWAPLHAQLSCPLSWAGIRFTGLPDRAPAKPWTPAEERPLTAEEEQQLEQLLTREPAPTSFGEFQEGMLAHATRLAEGTAPAPDQALAVARLMRDRLNSSHQDNLFIALAWLHEALASTALSEVDRHRLSVEAAHLWLDVAWGELMLPLAPDSVALARAGRLLASVAAERDADADAAHVRYEILRQLSSAQEPVQRERARREGLARFGQALRRVPPGAPEAPRVAALTLEWLATFPEEERGDTSDFLKMARGIVAAMARSSSTEALYQRLRGALAHLEPDETRTAHALMYLTPRELYFTAILMSRDEPSGPGFAITSDIVNGTIARLEEAIWGNPGDDGHPLVWTTGTPGAAYRMLVKSLLAGHTRSHPEDAAHRIACLQFACDLRVTFLNRLARRAGWVSEGRQDPIFEPLWRLLRLRRVLHTALVDAALLPGGPRAEDGTQRPHGLDPFTHSVDAIRQKTRGPVDITAWNLADACDAREERPRQVRTAAFETALASALLEADAVQRWTALREAETEALRQMGEDRPLLSTRLTFGRRLKEGEEYLRTLPEGEAVLGLSLTPTGELLLMASWNDGTEHGQWTLQFEAVRVVAGLSLLLTPDTSVDGGPRRGEAGSRKQGWRFIEEALAPALETLLSSTQRRRKLRWSLIAPGALRVLPLLGLRVRGQPLASLVEALAHRPSLDFFPRADSDSTPRKDFTACLLAREKEEGTTCFGEAAVETLRRLRTPDLLVDPQNLQGSTVVEVEILEGATAHIRTLRLYGVGGLESLNDTTALMRLEGDRMLRERNTHGLLLPRGEVVELWASTAGGAGLKRLIRDDMDCIPGLARSFLETGAGAVIDLAWPVHDIVKALVCEGYGMARMRMGHCPHALARAITRTADLLEQLRKQAPHGTREEVLTTLDGLRRSSAHELFQVDPELLVPFSLGVNSPAIAHLSGAELVEELCQPVHLGACRWWGT